VRRLALAGGVLLAALGCADIPGITPTPPALPVPPSPAPESYRPAEGSLWMGDASRRFLAFENRAKRIGDLVTVEIAEQAAADSTATTDLNRKSTFDATLNSGVALQTLVTRPILNLLGFLGFTDQKTDKEPTGDLDIVHAETESVYDGEGTVERGANFTTTVACLVTGISESGLLRIEGERQLRINNETQVISLSGWVRPEDIQIDNTVSSSLVASADIQYSGIGVVSDKQRVAWFARLFELFLPF
jgi:flagellar L-ring protein precursor FlgH